jgi:hypothetical protein
MLRKKFDVIHLDHSDNEVNSEFGICRPDVNSNGDLILYDVNGEAIAGFSKGRWHSFKERG